MNYVPPRRSDGTIQIQREALPWPETKPFRILSIDGGGIRGILPAAVLMEIEKRFLNGNSIASYFDMIAGTSTGGIVALGLANGKKASEILEMYVERGDKIFPPANRLGRIRRAFRRSYRSAYDRKPLEDELLRIFGQDVLGDARTRLCIPTFEGVHGEPWIYKTPHHPDYKKDRHERIVRVALATTAAPTYLEALENNGYRMVDGGIWANNPVMNALADSLACFRIKRRQVKILSLGCGSEVFRVSDVHAAGGLFQWRNIIDAAMKAQSHNALGQAYLLVGKDNVLRVDAPEDTDPVALDDYQRAREKLPAMARSLVEAAGREVQRVFLAERAEPYIPCPIS